MEHTGRFSKILIILSISSSVVFIVSTSSVDFSGIGASRENSVRTDGRLRVTRVRSKKGLLLL